MPYTEQSPAPHKHPKRDISQCKTECQAPHRRLQLGYLYCIWGLRGMRKGGRKKTSTEVLLTSYHRFPRDCFSSDQDAYHVTEKNKLFITVITCLDNPPLTRHRQQAAFCWESSLDTKSPRQTNRRTSLWRLCEDARTSVPLDAVFTNY